MNRQDANNSLLEVRDLAKYFAQGKGFFGLRTRPVQAVDGVSLSVKRQESLGLVGLTLGPTEMRRLWRNMQMIFQNPFSSLNPRLNVLKLVSEPLRTHTDLRGDALSSRVVELLVAVARALALNPKLLILDEPTSALDVSVQAQILNLLQELQREFNLTYLFISHNLSVVQHVSDRIAVMYLGKVVELSTSETIFGGALHPYTEALLSSTPIPDPDVKKKRIVLEGGVPSSINPPPGCRFHPRCPKVMPLCSQVEPELIDMGNGHLVACHIYARPT